MYGPSISRFSSEEAMVCNEDMNEGMLVAVEQFRILKVWSEGKILNNAGHTSNQGYALCSLTKQEEAIKHFRLECGAAFFGI
jgi:hypothetical protein